MFSYSYNNRPTEGAYRPFRGDGRRSYIAKSAVPTFSGLPWEKADEVYREAALLAEETGFDAYKQKVDAKYQYLVEQATKEWEALHPEEGSNESGYTEQLMHPGYTDYVGSRSLGSIKRKAGQDAVASQFIDVYGLKVHGVAILAELITHLSRCRLKKNDNGLFSGLEFCKDHFNTPRTMGMYRILMHDARSNYLSTQYKMPAREYSALVPLILYAHKLVHKVPYSAWDPKQLQYVVNHNLCEAMLWMPDELPNTEVLLADREIGLRVKTGKDAGKDRSPISTHKLYATAGTCYHHVPGDAQVMLSQIWVAHPNNRTKYMVLDPKLWDAVPPQLIESDVLVTLSDDLIHSTTEERPTWG